MEFESFPGELVEPLKPVLGILGVDGPIASLRTAVEQELGTHFLLNYHTQFVPRVPGTRKKAGTSRKEDVCDGWIRKFLVERPAAIVDVHAIGRESDSALADDLVRASRSVADTGTKYYAVVYTQPTEHDSTVGARCEALAKRTQVPITLVDNWARLADQLGSLRKTLLEQAQQFYREQQRLYRRKMSAHGTQGPAAARYHYKMAVMSEFRGDHAASLKDYHAAYTALADRRAEPRPGAFVDLLAAKACRMLMLVGSEKEAEELLASHLAGWTGGRKGPDLLRWRCKMLAQFADDLALMPESPSLQTCRAHHAGYFYLAAAHDAIRLQRTLASSVHRETLSAFCEQLAELLLKSYRVYQHIGAVRFSLYIARLIARLAVQTAQYDRAIKSIAKLVKAYRITDSWIGCCTDLLSDALACAEALKDGQAAAECLWQLASVQPDCYTEDFESRLFLYSTWTPVHQVVLGFPSTLNSLVHCAFRFLSPLAVVYGTAPIDFSLVVSNWSPLVLSSSRLELAFLLEPGSAEPSAINFAVDGAVDMEIVPGSCRNFVSRLDAATPTGTLSVRQVRMEMADIPLVLLFDSTSFCTRNAPVVPLADHHQFQRSIVSYTEHAMSCQIQPVKPQLQIDVDFCTPLLCGAWMPVLVRLQAAALHPIRLMFVTASSSSLVFALDPPTHPGVHSVECVHAGQQMAAGSEVVALVHVYSAAAGRFEVHLEVLVCWCESP